MMEEKIKFRDLIYFDFEKATSLLSQCEGGFTKEIQSQVNSESEERNLRDYNLHLFGGGFGNISRDNTSKIETRVLHDYILVRVEEELFNQGILKDINLGVGISPTLEETRGSLTVNSYVRVEGWSKIEDYSQLKMIANNFSVVVDFINQCCRQNLSETEEFKKLGQDIKNLREEAGKVGDKKRKKLLVDKTKDGEKQLKKLLDSYTPVNKPADWLLKGMCEWIDIFMKDRINFRIFPFENLSSFQIISNLKRNCFVDSDLENLLFAYGTRPNVKLTVMGLITSLPESDSTPFDPMKEFEAEKDKSNDQVQFEHGFRNLFSTFEGFEEFTRFSRFPNVTIYPIAVYRKFI